MSLVAIFPRSTPRNLDLIGLILALLLIARAREYISARVVIDEAGCWVWQKSGDGRYGHAEFLGGAGRVNLDKL